MSSLPTSRSLQDLPAEVTLSIISHLDKTFSIAFALTSRTHHHLVTASKGALRSLQPPFEGYKHISRHGDRPHEVFACVLWTWLGNRCAYCGLHEVLAQDRDNQGKWVYSRHLCRGWLTQYTQQSERTRERKTTSFEFAESLDSQPLVLKRLHHLRYGPVDAKWRREMETWMRKRGMW